MNDSLNKLIAITLSDGSVDRKRYTVEFTEAEEVVNRFISEIKQIGDLKINWKTDKYKNSLRARTYSKELVKLMMKFSPTFRTRSYDKHPRNPENENGYSSAEIPKECFSKKFIRTFLRYYSTCDGGPNFSVYKRKDKNCLQIDMSVKIGCENPKLKQQIYDMLKKIGIQSNIIKNGISIKKIEEIKKFHKKVKFIDESKVRRGKLFKGFKKNDVVKLMILCGSLTKKLNWINKNFENISDIEKFLITCIQQSNNKIELNKIILTKLNI